MDHPPPINNSTTPPAGPLPAWLTYCRSKAETALRRAQYLITPLRAPVSMKLPLCDHCMHLMAVSWAWVCVCVCVYVVVTPLNTLLFVGAATMIINHKYRSILSREARRPAIQSFSHSRALFLPSPSTS